MTLIKQSSFLLLGSKMWTQGIKVAESFIAQYSKVAACCLIPEEMLNAH